MNERHTHMQPLTRISNRHIRVSIDYTPNVLIMGMLKTEKGVAGKLKVIISF